MKRRKTRQINIGGVKIGGGAPVSIQSMTKTDTSDVAATLRQIKALDKAGCQIVRIAIKDKNAAAALEKIMKKTPLPVEADIHFNYRLALSAIESGADAIRLNPGNIYRKSEIEPVVKQAKKRKIPIRVGVNSGSITNAQGLSFGNAQFSPPWKTSLVSAPRSSGNIQSSRDTMAARSSKRPAGQNPSHLYLASMMTKSALSYIKLLEGMNFHDINVSLKASDVISTMDAYKLMAKKCDYPFHLGVTAAGLPEDGAIKSAMGIGSLLADGIGDTIRVSLAGDPVEEVKVAKKILSALDLRKFGPELIVCPTCGRTQIDVVGLAKELETKLAAINHRCTAKIAIMGCEVNGPGEAKDADIGIAGGKNCGILFKKGKIVKKIPEKNLVKVLLSEIVPL